MIGSAAYYAPLFKEANIQWIFLDQRAFAKSTEAVTVADFELDKIVDDIEMFRQHIGIEAMAIMGHSGNGYLALAYAQAHPDKVTHLMLCAVSPDLSQKTFEDAEAFWQKDASAERQNHFKSQIVQLEADLQNSPERKMAHICRRMGAKRWFDYTFDEKNLWKDVHFSPLGCDILWGDVFTRPTWFNTQK